MSNKQAKRLRREQRAAGIPTKRELRRARELAAAERRRQEEERRAAEWAALSEWEKRRRREASMRTLETIRTAIVTMRAAIES
jgi:hypothetical protein